MFIPLLFAFAWQKRRYIASEGRENIDNMRSLTKTLRRLTFFTPLPRGMVCKKVRDPPNWRGGIPFKINFKFPTNGQFYHPEPRDWSKLQVLRPLNVSVSASNSFLNIRGVYRRSCTDRDTGQYRWYGTEVRRKFFDTYPHKQ